MDAPGAQPGPGHSQIGKSVISDRGGSIHDPDFFQHNVYSRIETETKLIPRMGSLPYTLLQHGKTE